MVVKMTLGQEIRYLKDLPKKLDRAITNENETFLRRVKKSAKLRAPKDTGALAQSIELVPARKGKNVKIWAIKSENRAAAPQEFGFKPHLAPIFNSTKMKPGFYFVRKNTPFMLPAIEHQLSNFAQQLNHATGGAMKSI